MAVILDGKELAKKIRANLKVECDELKQKGIMPKLAVIMVGNDSASKVYVKNKSKACEDVGVEFEEFLLDENTTQEQLENLIEELNENDKVHGILLQSPIPKNLNINRAFEKISPLKDVDGFHPTNVGKLALNQDTFVSCTPFGVIKILEEYNINLGFPIAEINISALFVCSDKLLVFEWHTVTVAFFCSIHWISGLPTMLLLPTTTQFLPEISTLLLFNNSMTPAGVQETKPGNPAHNAPTFWGWKPSTSFFGSIAKMTLFSSIWWGNGNWTRMPWTLSSWFNVSIKPRSASSEISSGNS